MSKSCIYPDCNTVLSRYNDGDCCADHEFYNRLARAGMNQGKPPEEEPVTTKKPRKTGVVRKR